MARKLRFAALIRVSTEKQAKQGESLLTQTSQLDLAVETLGGIVVKWYGKGKHEHATAGWERKERDAMLAAAEQPKPPFDAVIVAHEDRWSRDDTRSGADLDRLLNAGIRFFVLDREQDLNDPTIRLYLGMSAVIGAYHAQANQSKKSIENRIERAKRLHAPTSGKRPFGRIWNGKEWSIDPDKQRMMIDVAKRYLAGEKVNDLAAKYGVNGSNLHKTLTKRCGTTWEQTFQKSKTETITVETIVPALLDAKTIAAVHERIEANRTYKHTQRRDGHGYLLSRMIFCAHCGYAMFGQTNHDERRYYRHAHHQRVRPCGCATTWVNAEVIESRVMDNLFKTLGNPIKLRKAIAAAIPNADEITELRAELKSLTKDLAKLENGRQRILKLVADDRINDDQAAKQLDALNTRESAVNADIERIRESLANVPTDDAVDEAVVRHKQFLSDCVDEFIALHSEPKSWKEQRGLCELAFAGKTDGRRNGVYITWKGKRWTFKIQGRLWLERDAVVQSASY